MSNRNLLSSINADMALETPQTLLSWIFENNLPELEFIRLRRSTYRYPETISDGTALLNEVVDNADLRVGYGDTGVAAGLVYYYSLFIQHKGPFASTRNYEDDIERLGTIRSVYPKHTFIEDVVIGTGAPPQTVFSGTIANIPVKQFSIIVTTICGAATRIVQDDGAGGWFGYAAAGSIDYDTGAWSITFTTAPDAAEPVYCDYGYGDQEFWILAKDNDATPVLWAYNHQTLLCDERIDFSVILNSGEEFIAIIDYVVSGSDRLVELATNQRYLLITFPTTVTAILAVHVTVEWDFNNKLDLGYEVTGACRDLGTPGDPTTLGVRILDSTNYTARLFQNDGTLIRDMDLTSLSDFDLRGLSIWDSGLGGTGIIIGANKVTFAVDTTNVVPALSGMFVTPVRQSITADFVGFRDKLVVIDNVLGILENYQLATYYDKLQIEENAYPGRGVIGLWRCEETSGNVIDKSGNGYDGLITGAVAQGETGKFDNSIKLDATNAYIDISAANPSFDETLGYISLWWKQPYSGWNPANAANDPALALFVSVGVGSIVLGFFGNDLLGIYQGAFGTYTCTYTDGYSDFEDGLFHHVTLAWDTAGNLVLYVDGVVKDTQAIGSAWGAGALLLYIGSVGAGGTETAIGYYDDVVLGDDAKTFFTRYSLTTKPHKAHALSGRDYSATNWPFRNRLKNYFGEEVLSHDYNQVGTTPNKVLSDGETIFREPSDDMVMGDLARTSRLFGLMIDRIVDKRNHFMNHLTARSVEDEYIKDLGKLIYAIGFDDNWNVEVKRRFLEVTFYCFQRFGTADAFKRMARFLGFRLWAPGDVIPTTKYRLRFDSCANPLRANVPFDTSRFDTSGSVHPFVTLLFTLFKENGLGANGVTSVPANRQFDSAGASFLTTTKVGSLLRIYDISSDDDNGYYYVTAVTSDTRIVVDRDWPVGSLTTLTYHIHWQVPEVDPYKVQVFERFRELRVRWQQLGYQSLP